MKVINITIHSYRDGKKLAGIIYLHRISDFRFGGIATRNFKMFRELCGEKSLKNVVIVTTMWSEVAPARGEAREIELGSNPKFFKSAIDKQASLLRHHGSLADARNILHKIIHNTPVSLCIQDEIVTEGKEISQTAAGEELGRELAVQAVKFQSEMKALQEQMTAAIRAKDEETKLELEEERARLRSQMTKVQMDTEKLLSNFRVDKDALQQRIWDMMVQHDQQRGALEWQLAQAQSKIQQDAIAAQLSQVAVPGPFSELGRQMGGAVDKIFRMIA